MNIQPTGSNVVIKVPIKVSKTDGGILIPESAKRAPPRTGVCVATGPGRMLDSGKIVEPRLRIGDEVAFRTSRKLSATEIILEEDFYLVMDESDVVAVLLPKADD